MTLCAWTEVYVVDVDKRGGNIMDGHAKLKPVFAQLLQLLNVLQIYNNGEPYICGACVCIFTATTQ